MKTQQIKLTNPLNLTTMKSTLITLTALVALALTSLTSIAQTTETESELAIESTEVLESMIEKSPNLQSFYDNSYGYAVFPKVTKGAITIGAAAGKGVIYKDHKVVSTSKLKQLTVGVQLGGQQYSEVIFFQTEEAFNNFMNNKLKFDAQASAVALKAGASTDAPYINGVLVFTQAIGGLMYEASLGGQHFANSPISN